MSQPLLTRHAYRPKPGHPFLGDLTLTRARAHEFCGPARRTLALMLAQKTDGPVFWISPSWAHERLHGDGVVRFIPPGRLTFITPNRPEDLLWATEEVLRSGCVPLVVCELPGVPGLTSVRRLHLAAENARRLHKAAPLGVLLIPGAGGAQGVESRWYMRQSLGEGDGNDAGKNPEAEPPEFWHLERRRARMAPPKSWAIRDAGGRRGPKTSQNTDPNSEKNLICPSLIEMQPASPETAS